DGIRDFHVTGVQTCALPIYHPHPIPLISRACLNPLPWIGRISALFLPLARPITRGRTLWLQPPRRPPASLLLLRLHRLCLRLRRSEERRVGKECSVGGRRSQ